MNFLSTNHFNIRTHYALLCRIPLKAQQYALRQSVSVFTPPMLELTPSQSLARHRRCQSHLARVVSKSAREWVHGGLYEAGNVYEKRLIEAYISENGVEPTSGEAITTEDLVDLRTPKSVRPRPPTLTSIPSLLGVFQEEWDALALETFTLRQNLAQTRQDLSNALYQHDAAVRVIARLTKERDEAREALSKVNVGNGATSNGDAMHVDPTPLPQNIVAKIEETHVSLSKTRRKRGVPAEWATGDDVEAYTSKRKFKAGYRGSTALSVRASGDLALVGTSEGMAGIYSMSQDKMSAKLPGGDGIITGAVWAGEKAVISTSKGKILVYNDAGEELGAFEAHTGSATSIALHPTEDILASVGKDQTYVLYDLEAMKVLAQVACDGGKCSVHLSG